MSVSLQPFIVIGCVVIGLCMSRMCKLCFRIDVKNCVRGQWNVVTIIMLLPDFTIWGLELSWNLMMYWRRERNVLVMHVCVCFLSICDAQSQLYGLTNTLVGFYWPYDAYSASKEATVSSSRRHGGNDGFLVWMHVWKYLLIRNFFTC